MKYKILKYGAGELRKKARPVTSFNKKLHDNLDKIYRLLLTRNDGAALAAPQVGILERIVVIDYEDEFFELINPEIIDFEGSQTDFEGCLSFPGLFGKVERPAWVKIKYQDRNGDEHVIERFGNMARCILHENDHLDGILFIDRMKDDYLVGDDDKKIELSGIKKSAGTVPSDFYTYDKD